MNYLQNQAILRMFRARGAKWGYMTCHVLAIEIRIFSNWFKNQSLRLCLPDPLQNAQGYSSYIYITTKKTLEESVSAKQFRSRSGITFC